jgi:hypothetical protein
LGALRTARLDEHPQNAAASDWLGQVRGPRALLVSATKDDLVRTINRPPYGH